MLPCSATTSAIPFRTLCVCAGPTSPSEIPAHRLPRGRLERSLEDAILTSISKPQNQGPGTGAEFIEQTLMGALPSAWSRGVCLGSSGENLAATSLTNLLSLCICSNFYERLRGYC